MTKKEVYSVIKSDGGKDIWNPAKLERSLLASGATTAMRKDILSHVEHDLRDGMTTGEIFEHAFSLLKKMHRPTAAKYSLKKALLQLGPSGFPFERFVAHMLEREGYKTKVGIEIRGMCVTHEVDVLAEKDDERIVVEAKYHNSPAIKTDVKVAMYVHARSEDIAKRYERDEGAKGKLHRSWLITNTNFTSQAITYGECVGLYMTGWNHPHGRTIQDIVEATQTHPITCLTSLTIAQKRALLERGKVLCRDVLTDLSILEEIGIGKQKLSTVVDESVSLCSITNSVATLHDNR